MDVGEKAKLEIEKRNEDSVSYHTTGLPCGIADFANSAMGMVTDDNFLSSMVDSYVAPVWEHPADSQHLGFSVPAGLQEPDSLFKGSLLFQLPTDAAFIERAAKLSSFSSGNIADFMNSFAMDQTGSPYNQHTSMLHGPHPVFMDTAIFQVSGGEPQKNETVPQMKNTRHMNEAKQEKSDESDSGGYGQEEPSLMDTGTKPCLSKKRKRQGQDTKLGQSQQLSGGDATINNSPHKQSSKAIDTPKKDYIHVRARRGQATNSHSLAERVRREKIRDRMKFLQDLVPGCSKVTGKAVMLDEIINYVQSLQRQVEFLSMKLATVDPRMGFKIDGLLAKDQIFATRASPSSLGLSPDMPMAYPLMNPSQPSLPAIGSSSDILRNLDSQIRNINQGYEDPTQQMPNVWNDELQNVVQMGFSPNAPLENQETPQNSSLPSGHMKVEV